MLFQYLRLTAAVVFGFGAATATPLNNPQVDLGYAIHEAHTVTTHGASLLNFSNIRYATPPTGARRFKAPELPLNNRSAGVQDGMFGNICPQGSALWLVGDIALAPPAHNENEDCLFLDVVLPSSLFPASPHPPPKKRAPEGNAAKPPPAPAKKGAPVIVWLHGGGYLLSNKAGNGDASDLIARSVTAGREGFIWVALNYRLGPLGFLSGPTFQAQGGLANTGLFDQVAALEWVRKNIHLFGGDPNRVTVAGASAGAGSIMHHLTAYGGRPVQPAQTLFKQAILQSPAIQPIVSHYTEDQGLQLILNAANVSTFEQLKSVDEPTMLRAQKAAQIHGFFGQFIYGPTPDGTYVPDIPGKLMLQGAFNPNVNILSGHNTFEAIRSVSPNVTTEDLVTYMQGYYPSAQAPIIDYISDTLYPAVYDGSQPYTSPFMRLVLAVTEANFACNTNWLARAYNNQTHNYLFSIPPGAHQEDLPYTFYPNTKPAVLNTTVATILQDITINFVLSGDPNGPGVPQFPVYGPGRLLNLNQTFINTVPDNVANSRCLFWQKALYE
ncbi:hypothetical protein MMC25_006217 [Agyrium rufum]|nr:hypothetical protein [Agyrium rufum]